MAFLAPAARLDTVIAPTPRAARPRSPWNPATLWSSLGISCLVMVVEMFLVPGLGLGEALVAVLVGNALFGLAALIGAEPHLLAMVSLRRMLGSCGTYPPGITWLVRAIRSVGTAADRTITRPPAQGVNRHPAPWFGAWLPGLRLVFWPTLLLGCWRRTYACP